MATTPPLRASLRSVAVSVALTFAAFATVAVVVGMAWWRSDYQWAALVSSQAALIDRVQDSRRKASQRADFFFERYCHLAAEVHDIGQADVDVSDEGHWRTIERAKEARQASGLQHPTPCSGSCPHPANERRVTA